MTEKEFKSLKARDLIIISYGELAIIGKVLYDYAYGKIVYEKKHTVYKDGEDWKENSYKEVIYKRDCLSYVYNIGNKIKLKAKLGLEITVDDFRLAAMEILK